MDDTKVQPTDRTAPARLAWLTALRWYVAISAGINLLWEVCQMPLYTVWHTSGWRQIAYAIAHCTVGDVMIAVLALTVALLLVGDLHWPAVSFTVVGGATIVAGFAYTIFSEWLNVVLRQSWAYAPAMPVLPPLGTGLSPMLQWLIVPSIALYFVRRQSRAAVRGA